MAKYKYKVFFNAAVESAPDKKGRFRIEKIDLEETDRFAFPHEVSFTFIDTSGLTKISQQTPTGVSKRDAEIEYAVHTVSGNALPLGLPTIAGFERLPLSETDSDTGGDRGTTAVFRFNDNAVLGGEWNFNPVIKVFLPRTGQNRIFVAPFPVKLFVAAIMAASAIPESVDTTGVPFP